MFQKLKMVVYKEGEMNFETTSFLLVDFSLAALLARYVLGFLFTVAGLAKVGARAEFEEVITKYDLLPPGSARLVSIGLPWVELAVGVLLLLGIFMSLAATIAASLLIGFIVVAVLNALRGKEAGCGCFGPRWRTRSGWLTVAARNTALLVLAMYLLLPYLTPSLTPHPSSLSSMLIGSALLSAALLFGLPPKDPRKKTHRMMTGLDLDRRRFLRYAAALAGGAVAGLFLESPGASAAQRSLHVPGKVIVEHEIDLPSLAEAIERAPHSLLLPQYVPSGYVLEKVGAFTRGAEGGNVRDVILHYGRDAYHRLTIKFSPKLEGNPCDGTLIDCPRIRGHEALLCETSPARHVLSWNDTHWHVSVIGMNVAVEELLAVARSM